MTDRWLLRRNSEFSRDSELRVPSAWCRPGPGVQLVTTGDHWTLPSPNCADSEYSSDPLLYGNILRSPISYPLKIWMNWISAAVTKYCSILYSLLQCAVGRKHRQCVGVRHYHHYCRHWRGGEGCSITEAVIPHWHQPGLLLGRVTVTLRISTFPCPQKVSWAYRDKS